MAVKMFRWQSMTHLLDPVVPDVKSISASSPRERQGG